MPSVAKSSLPGEVPQGSLGIGVLGCADIALRRFLPALAASERARLVAVASRDGRKAAETAGGYGCAAMGCDELLQSEQVDLVYLPLPNHLHEEWCLAALRQGKHVLCEKPLALDAGSAGRILAQAEACGRLVFENIMYLQHPQHDRVKQIIGAGNIGALTALNCVFTFPGPAPGDFRLDPLQGGGAFHDLNRYPLSAASHFLSGAIDEILHCQALWRDQLIFSMEAEARSTAQERFTFRIAFGQPYRCCYEIVGTQGSLRLERAFTSPAGDQCRLDICRNGSEQSMPMPADDHFRLTIDHVAALIADGSAFAAQHQQWRSLALTADRFMHLAHAQKRPS